MCSQDQEAAHRRRVGMGTQYALSTFERLKSATNGIFFTFFFILLTNLLALFPPLVLFVSLFLVLFAAQHEKTFGFVIGRSFSFGETKSK